jgi:hypothetical protein
MVLCREEAATCDPRVPALFIATDKTMKPKQDLVERFRGLRNDIFLTLKTKRGYHLRAIIRIDSCLDPYSKRITQGKEASGRREN